MPILRAQKEDLVAKLTEELQDSRVALVFAYTALNMKANDTLRTRAFEGGAKVKMVSNTLLALILKNIGKTLEIPQKTLALAYGFADEVVAAKTLVEFAKETETLEILGGWVDGNFFDAAQVNTLSSLPNKETLQAQLVGRLGGLIGSLAYSLNYPIQKFAFVIEAVKSAQPAVAEVKAEEKLADVAEESKEETKTEEPVAETIEEPAPTDEQSIDAAQDEPTEETKTEVVEEPDSSDESLAKSEEVKEEVKE